MLLHVLPKPELHSCQAAKKKLFSLTFTLYYCFYYFSRVLLSCFPFLSKKELIVFVVIHRILPATDDGLRDKLNNCILIAFPNCFYHKQISIIYKTINSYRNWESYWHKTTRVLCSVLLNFLFVVSFFLSSFNWFRGLWKGRFYFCEIVDEEGM